MGTEQVLLSQKGRRVGRGVKEKHDLMVGESPEVGEHGNVALGSISTTRTISDVNGVLEYPNVSEAHGTQAQTSAIKENMNEVSTTTGPTPWHTLLLLTMLGTPGVNMGLFVMKKWHPDVNLLKEDFSTIPVWVKLHGVPVTAFGEDGLSAIATKIDTPLMLDSYTSNMCMQSWGRSSYTRAMIELQADVELKDNIVVVMPKITREGHYICNICVEYEWKPSRCASCKVFGHIPKECLKNIGVGETKKLKNTSQAPKGIPVGLNVGFKPHKEYRPISKKTIANSSGNKKKGVDHINKVSDSNPFKILNLDDNDVKMGTNGGRQIWII
ncbi:zinc finger, CCHC-type containing protein, partial [Tanacetum coccineum]